MVTYADLFQFDDIRAKSLFTRQVYLLVGTRLYGPPHMEREAVLKAPRECGMWEERGSTKCETLRISSFDLSRETEHEIMH